MAVDQALPDSDEYYEAATSNSDIGTLFNRIFVLGMSGVKVGLVAAALVSILGVYFLIQPADISYLTRIRFATQPKVTVSQFNQKSVLRLAPVMGDDLGSRKLLTDLAPQLSTKLQELSEGRFMRLRDIDFLVTVRPEYVDIQTLGIIEEKPFHTAFHNVTNQLMLDRLKVTENEVKAEVNVEFQNMVTKLDGVRQQRRVSTFEREETISFLENLLAKVSLNDVLDKQKTTNPVGMQGIVLETKEQKNPVIGMINAFVVRRENLATEAETIAQSLRMYEILKVQTKPTKTEFVGLVQVPETALSSSVRIIIWAFLAFLAFVTFAMLWGVIRSANDSAAPAQID